MQTNLEEPKRGSLGYLRLFDLRNLMFQGQPDVGDALFGLASGSNQGSRLGNG